MAVIAVVAAGGVVAWARLGQSQAGGAEVRGGGEPLPEQMEGGFAPGEVPPEVAAAVGGPVVGVARVEDVPDDVFSGCADNPELEWDEPGPELVHGFATPEAVTLLMAGAQAGDVAAPVKPGAMPDDPEGRLLMRCSVHRDEDGRWLPESADVVSAEGEGPGQGAFMSMSCCDEQGYSRVSGGVLPPDGTAWVLQDRGDWHLAYPADVPGWLVVTWKHREGRFSSGPPASRVLFVDAEGDTIGEDFVGGAF